MVVGTDIAELLMKDSSQDTTRPLSVNSNASSAIIDGITPLDGASMQSSGEAASRSVAASDLKEDVVTNKFREYLIYGSGKEALGIAFGFRD